MIFIHIVSIVRIALLLHVQPLLRMSLSILAYFFEACRKSWRARSQATGLLTEELPPSVISAANQDIMESSKKESLRHCKHMLKMPRCQGFLSARTKTHCAMFLVVAF